MQEKKSLKNFKIKKLTVVGVIPSFAFQRAKFCAIELHKKLPQKFPLPEIVGLLELDWSEKLQEWRQTLGRSYWCLRRPVAVFFNDQFIGSDIELIKLITIRNVLMENIPRKTMSSMKQNYRKDYIAYLKKSKRIYCYLDICIEEVYAGTLTFQLYSDLLPRTCENFKTLCLGSRGPLLSYRGSRIHRIVKHGWLQGGDVQYKSGGGGFSIFCDPLEDECFGISHDRRGVLSMASAGRHKNGSQFFITLQPSKWMDTRFVAFGQLIEGAKVLKTLENLETFYECPLKKVEIKSCGKLDLEDVEDVDVMYKEEPMPQKKPKRIETISDQVLRLIIEALTEALERKERTPDVLDDGDIPSKMNLQLYFQGFYSLPESALEQSAAYLRDLRRKLLRVVKPNATEIVEVVMYDLLMAVLTRMTTLDDVRETIGHSLYEKMISGIDMELELCRKAYVKKFVDQVAATAISIVDLVTRKLRKMKSMSENLKKFNNRMQGWVRSFVLQETFADDSYLIAERPVVAEKPKEEEKEYPKRAGKPCCEEERKKKEEELKAKLRAKYAPADLCCLGSKIHLSESVINLYDFFSTCRYDLKRVPKEKKERIPLLDLIEMKRFQLKLIRHHENRLKDEGRLCAEKKIRRWMMEVVYTPETSWLKEAVFPRDCVVLDHVEEILYGAMTAGLLEMYYFMEEYLKRCGRKKQRLVVKVVYPEDSVLDVKPPEVKKEAEDGEKEEVKMEEEEEGVKEEEEEEKQEEKKEEIRPPCPCGHPCCKCPYDPNFKPSGPPTPPPSLEEVDEGDEEGEGGEEEEGDEENPLEETTEKPGRPCASDETLVDLNALMAETASVGPEEIDIRSFRWLKPYILEKGCDLKSEFAGQVHKWLEGERFSYKGFISKHSLPTRASLLSLSLSLAELIREENNLKTEIKDFIYDLWELYFEEMIKEAYLEFPQEKLEHEEEFQGEGEEKTEDEEQELGKMETDGSSDDECKKVSLKALQADFDKYYDENCADIKREVPEEAPREAEAVEAEEERKESPKLPEAEVQPEPKPKESEKEEPQKAQPKPEPEVPKMPSSTGDNDSLPHQESQISSVKIREDSTKPHADHAVEDAVEPPSDDRREEEPVKKRKSPIVIEELVDEPSEDEYRVMPPYVPPFWIKFLTELTKQALGAIAKVSRLPRRLYFTTESEMGFDDKMKEWFDFNAFNPQPTKGREIMDFIALQHRSLVNLEDTARGYLKKKKYSELINRCTRFSSAEDMAEEIVVGVIDSALDKTTESETLDLFISDLLSSAVTSTPVRSLASTKGEDDEISFDTDQRVSNDETAREENHEDET